MSEYANVNTCDLKCPRKALLAVELREDGGLSTERSLGRLGVLVAKGAQGAWQAGRTAFCPQRNLPAETWTPRQECADHVRQTLVARTIDVDALNDYERETLEPYLP